MAPLGSEFQHQRLGERRVWLRRHLAGRRGAEALADPERLLERVDCQVVKQERKVTVARVTLEIDGCPTSVYLKRHHGFSFLERVVSVLRRSRGRKALEGAVILERLGVPVATALGAVERRRGAMLLESFSFSEEIVDARTADLYWLEHLAPLGGARGRAQRRRFLAALAELLHRLHVGRVYHGDFKAKNLVVAPSDAGGRLHLLDLETVRACWYLSRRRRLKNLVQLNRTLGKLLTDREKLSLLRAYTNASGGSRRELRRSLRRILAMSERADRRSERKRRASA